MERRKIMRRLSLIAILLMVTAGIFTALGCGGGGAGSESVSYTGITSPAYLDTTVSAVDIWEIIQAAASGDSYANTGFIPFVAVSDNLTVSDLLDPGRAQEFLLGVLGEKPVPVVLAASAVPLNRTCSSGGESGDTGTVEGTICGEWDGSQYTSIDYLSVTFTNFSADGSPTFDGSMILDMTGGSIELIFRDLSIDDGVDDIFIDGVVSVESAGSVVTVYYNVFILVDGVSSEGIWINDMMIVETDYSGYYHNSIDGRIYDVLEGYVDIETIEELEFDDGALYPKNGTIKLTGAGGVSITIDFTAYAVVDIAVDTDGDGTNDWFSYGNVIT